MVVDYLHRIESLDLDSLERQEKADILIILAFLEKRARNPELTREIKHYMFKLAPVNPRSRRKRS